MSSLQNRILAQKNLVQQKIQDMEEINRILKNKRYRKILDEKIEISEKLLSVDLSNRLEHLKYLEQKIGIGELSMKIYGHWRSRQLKRQNCVSKA